MQINNFISNNTYEQLINLPIKTFINENKNIFASDYYLEEIRKQIISIFGEDYLYKGGLSVRTSLNTETQLIVDEVLKEGLMAYDKRHGYRGIIGNNPKKEWQ